MFNKFTYFLFFVLVLIAAGTVTTKLRAVGYSTGYEPDQPIAYSHKLHAGDLGIDCQYCHFAADKGRHAGIPPVGVCMNCHTIIKKNGSPEIKKVEDAYNAGKSIEWVKVHHFPDYAYFNHSQHVRVGKKACQECHGPVETMDRVYQKNDLSMGWCIQCHRDNGIMPPADHKSMAGGDCSKCHY
jgi:hypothetical protein